MKTWRRAYSIYFSHILYDLPPQTQLTGHYVYERRIILIYTGYSKKVCNNIAVCNISYIYEINWFLYNFTFWTLCIAIYIYNVLTAGRVRKVYYYYVPFYTHYMWCTFFFQVRLMYHPPSLYIYNTYVYLSYIFMTCSTPADSCSGYETEGEVLAPYCFFCFTVAKYHFLRIYYIVLTRISHHILHIGDFLKHIFSYFSFGYIYYR